MDIPVLSVRIFDPFSGIWPDGCVDRNVYRLDGARDRIYPAVPQSKMAAA